MHFYAQINDDNICFSISQLSGEVELKGLIPITAEQFAQGLLGWTYKDGEWLNTVSA